MDVEGRKGWGLEHGKDGVSSRKEVGWRKERKWKEADRSGRKGQRGKKRKGKG